MSVKTRRFKALPYHSTYRIISSQTEILNFSRCAQTFYRLRTSRTTPEVLGSLFSLSLGICHDGIHQLQDVLLRMDIVEGVIPKTLFEVDGIQDLQLITVIHQHLSTFNDQGSLRVVCQWTE